jgi:hypothetical protein
MPPGLKYVDEFRKPNTICIAGWHSDVSFLVGNQRRVRHAVLCKLTPPSPSA